MSEPAWRRVNLLFAKFGLEPPPVGLRDHIVILMRDAEDGDTARELLRELVDLEDELHHVGRGRTFDELHQKAWAAAREHLEP